MNCQKHSSGKIAEDFENWLNKHSTLVPILSSCSLSLALAAEETGRGNLLCTFSEMGYSATCSQTRAIPGNVSVPELTLKQGLGQFRAGITLLEPHKLDQSQAKSSSLCGEGNVAALSFPYMNSSVFHAGETYGSGLYYKCIGLSVTRGGLSLLPLQCHFATENNFCKAASHSCRGGWGWVRGGGWDRRPLVPLLSGKSQRNQGPQLSSSPASLPRSLFSFQASLSTSLGGEGNSRAFPAARGPGSPLGRCGSCRMAYRAALGAKLRTVVTSLIKESNSTHSSLSRWCPSHLPPLVWHWGPGMRASEASSDSCPTQHPAPAEQAFSGLVRRAACAAGP